MITNRAYIDQRVDELKEYLSALRSADQESLAAARTSLIARLESMNEFRAALSEQAASFVPRNEVEATTQRTNQRLEEATAEHSLFVRRPEHDQLVSRITALESRVTLDEGQVTGSGVRTQSLRQTTVIAVAVAGLLVTLLVTAIDHFVH